MTVRHDPTALLDIIDTIYAAALDDSWQAVVNRLSAHFDESPFHIFGHNFALGKADIFLTANHSEDQIRQYGEYYHEINPWVPGILSAGLGSVCSVEDYLPGGELLRTEFYNDWLRPHGDIIGGGGALLHASEDRSLIIGGSLRRSDRDDREVEMLDLFERIIPHLYRAFDIQLGLRGANLVRDHLDTALESLASGTLLLDRLGRVVYLNGRASEMLAQGTLLHRNHFGELKTYDPEADAALHAGLAALNGGAAEAGRHLFAIRDRDDGQTFFGLLAPLRQSREMVLLPAIKGREPVALLIVVAPKNDDADLVKALQKVLGLTPAEAGVAIALYQGESLRDYADTAGVSIHTVRNQVKAALAKTGCRRQGDLVRQVARIAQLTG